MAPMKTPPKVYVGTGTWAGRWKPEEEIRLPPILRELGIREMDTAPTYPLLAPGLAEKSIGMLPPELKKGLRIDSKIHYTGNGDGTLTAEAITKSLDASLEATAMDKLNILYCHGPDRKTPIEEQAAAMDAEYRKGKFLKLGVQNFPQDMLEEWLRIAGEKGYVKPTIFQGQYNLLCRAYEEKLFPLLRKHKIYFVASSGLAGGFLTGKATLSTKPEDLKGSRFDPNDSNLLTTSFKNWYDKPSMHAAVRKMKDLCEKHDMEMGLAAFGWLLYHSILDGGSIIGDKGDAVLIGPNSLFQLEKYTEAYVQGPLPAELAQGLTDLWDEVKDDAQSIIAF